MDKDERRRIEQGKRLAAARADAGYKSARAAALELGWRESSYRAHENGTRTIGQDDADRYAAAFRAKGVDVTGQAILYAGATIEAPGIIISSQTAAPVIRPSGPEVSEIEKVGEGWPDVGNEWMDVRGVTVGGDDSYFYFGDVIDKVRRPPGIRNAQNVAALNVTGTSMVPAHKPGALIYVQLREPESGDDVVVELYPENEGDAPKSFLKELVRKTGRRLECIQHNPASPIEFDRGEVHRLWRVLTLRDLLG